MSYYFIIISGIFKTAAESLALDESLPYMLKLLMSILYQIPLIKPHFFINKSYYNNYSSPSK